MKRALLLRHPPVAAQWGGRCYGRTDAGLSAEGRGQARRWSCGDFARVVTSPARRARWPAALLARRRGLPLEIEPRVAERDFGAWEGMSWDSIWQAEGDAMNGMIDAPGSFRPGGGETTAELALRVLDWWRGIPDEPILVIAHGGPIAALAGSLRNLPVREWLGQIPAPGEGLLIQGDAVSRWKAP
ncbi:histidine phosphatase family protein [Roseococcus sp. YIM B11640]|uniref:histidine phosphatase family protein n=1 Tax=Roseococcus sp. YIM B11640 TaxID=3133973 RepID=UPI003C7A036F